MKAIMISIRPEHVVNILNGKKTLELRKSVPKGFVGWVYIYVTKAKPYLFNETRSSERFYTLEDDRHLDDVFNLLNGKVVARFWLDEYIAYKYYKDDNTYFAKRIQDFGYGAEEVLKRSYLTRDEFKAYGKGKDLYAWHIKKLEIFDRPKELHHFYIFRERIIQCGMDCPPYVDEVKTTLTKAPQSWQYVWVKE
jgi:predicted transcriptional regulator